MTTSESNGSTSPSGSSAAQPAGSIADPGVAPGTRTQTLVFAAFLLLAAVAWAALLLGLSHPRAAPDSTAMALHILAVLLVYAVTVASYQYRLRAGIPYTLIAGGVVYVLTDIGDVVNARAVLPEPLDAAFASGLLTLLASALALAGVLQWMLHSQQALRRETRMNRRLAMLNEMMRELRVTLEPDAIARVALGWAVRALRAEGGTVLFSDARTGELEFVAVEGPDAGTLIGLRLPPGTGIAGWAARQSRAVRVGDAQADSRFYAGVDRLTGRATRSLLAVPIRGREGVLGVIELINRTRLERARARASEFGEDDQVFMDLLAQSVAAALENARQMAQTQARLRELQILHESSATIASSLTSAEVLQALARHILHAVNAGGVVVSTWSDGADFVRPVASEGEGLAPDRNAPRRSPLGKYALALQVLRRQQPAAVRVDDAQVDPAEREVLQAANAQSLLILPLVAKERSIGLIEVFEVRFPRAFEEDEIRLIQSMSNQAALAVEEAQLFEELRERAERLGRAYADLQGADRRRADFVANVSHELRTPLTFLRSHAELLLAEELGPLTTEQRNSLSVIARKADALARLTSDLVTLESLESAALRREPVDLGRLAVQAMQASTQTAAQAGVELVADIPAELPPVLADEQRVAEVFDNLLSNALKFTPAGGRIVVRVAEGADALLASVTDNGRGIPAEAQERVFDRFYQVPGGDPHARGSGLGLAICLAIVRAHGGDIGVDSEVGRGSTFYFTLPKAPKTIG